VGALLVVVPQVLRDIMAPSFEGSTGASQTLILEGTVEPFQVRIVIRLPDPGMAMGEPSFLDTLGEPLGKLTAVV